jgi:hypothetical protein
VSDAYQLAVLADTPVVYYRLDQLGFGVNGELVPDSSGNVLDASLVFTGGAPAWGHLSPIETDSASREFWGYTNADLYSPSFTGVSRITRASDALMQPSPKDFTVEQWLRPMDERPTASDFVMVQKQGTGGTLLGGGATTRIGGFCFDSASTFFRVVDTSFRVIDYLGTSFHVVVVRSGDALALYINGTFRASTTITSGLSTLFNSNPFGIHPNTAFASNARHDEAAYYNYALGADRILAHYEAALLVLDMRGEANIRTTAVLDGSDAPDPVGYPFRHNWDEPVIERFRWRTGTFRPTDGSHALARQRSAPRRQVEYAHLLYTERLRRQYEARAFGGQTAKVQFESDKVRVDDLAAGATGATGDFQYMRFEVGHEVLVWQDDDTFEYQTLDAVSDTTLQWAAGLSRAYTAPWLKPVRTARLPPDNELDAETDTVGVASTIYELLEQDEPLAPRGVTPWTSTFAYRDREAFDLREWQGHDYSEVPTIQFVAERSRVDEETGLVATKQYRWGSEQLQPYNMNLQGRPLIAKYLGWLYERAGRYRPFWMPTFRQDLKPEGITGLAANELRVEGHEYTNLYAASDTRIDLAFVYFDNTVVMRRVDSAVASDVYDVLTLDAARPTFTNLRWLSFLRRVVLSSDDLEIAWHTDNVVRVAFAVVDAPLDFALGSPSVSPSPSPSVSPTPSISASVSGSASPSASVSPSSSPSPSLSPSASGSPSASVSPSVSISPSLSPSASPSPSASGSPSASLSPSVSVSPSVSPSASPSPSASGSPSGSVSPSVSPSLSQSPSASKSPSASLSPSSSISPSRSPSASMSPSSSPSPST